jgi:hypothetical protein
MDLALPARRAAALAAALACTTALAASPAAAHPPPPIWEYTCGGTEGDAVAYDQSHDFQKIPDATETLVGVQTSSVSDRLSFPDISPYGYKLYCVRIVADIVHPDRTDLRVDVLLPNATGWRVVYSKDKPGPDLHLRNDRPWSHPDWARLRITDLEPGGSGALVYWRAEGHYRRAPSPPPPPAPLSSDRPGRG